MSVRHMWTLQEIIEAARRNLSQNAWDYLIGGAETETTVKRNRLAIDSRGFRPRVLNDVSGVSTEAVVLGHRLRLPVFLPPIGSLQLFEAGGGASVARAAQELGSLSFLSSVSDPELEEVAQVSTAPKVYQLYAMGDDAWLQERFDRAVAAGYTALCLTVDTAVYSRRERDLLKRYIPPSGSRSGDFGFQAKLSWDLVRRLKDRYDVPLVLKGIATAEDAALACENGVEVIYVSNHGGRQLDSGRGTLDILPEVVKEVRGRAEVFVDGGFLRGSDVVKAMALGATAVGVGRLECFGLAAGGTEGVVRMLEIVESEVQICLALLGVNALDQLHASHLAPAPPVSDPHVTGAFPFLDRDDGRY